MSIPESPPNWYPDPMGRHEYRWFDGRQWTQQISDRGIQGVDPVHGPGRIPDADITREKFDYALRRAGADDAGQQGGGTLFTEPVLVVSQKAKFIELQNEYAILDQNGHQVGAVRQVGQSTAKKVLRAVSSLDQFMTHSLQIVDHDGSVRLQITRPRKVMKSRFIVQDGAGTQIGEIVQQNMVGKIRFGMVVGGVQIGSINAENWRAWNFSIQDENEEIARITKTWVGLAKAMFTTADNYVVQIHRPLEGALQAMTIAAAVSVDTALKQDNRGFN